MQRLFDILFSGLALTILTPFVLPLIFILKVSGEGEIFFFQERVGKGRKYFKLYKFATMKKNSPNIGTGTVTIKNDPRILPLGNFLRKTNINELPQLINILKGDMSFIGPRPQTKRCFSAFPLSSQKEIVKVRPGLSGVGSIIFRSEEEMMQENNDPEKFYDEIVMPYKGSLETWYVSHQSITSYFYLIMLTILVILGLNIRLIWRIFNDLPLPPPELNKWI